MRVLITLNDTAIDCVSAESVERAEQLLSSLYPGATFLPCPDGVGPGMMLVDGTWQVISQPVQELPSIDVLKRLPMAKRIGIRQANDPVLKDIMGLFDAADIVHKDDPDTIAAFAYLIDQGYLTADEVNAIWR